MKGENLSLFKFHFQFHVHLSYYICQSILFELLNWQKMELCFLGDFLGLYWTDLQGEVSLLCALLTTAKIHSTFNILTYP